MESQSNFQAILSPRQELLKIQKRVFAKNNQTIRSQTLVREKGFDLYERRYKRRVRDYEEVSSLEELLNAVRRSDIVFVGDYHTNPQSQRTLLRILKQISDLVPGLAIGLEIVLARHQRHLDDFLRERIAEETFLERIKFRKYWYFDLWQNFKPIFDFAKYHEMPLFGFEYSLDGDATLEKRDRESAQVIASFAEAHPDRKLIIFAGDLHIAPDHLPGRVEAVLKTKGIRRRSLIVYQNSEAIYWRLAEQEMEDKVEVVRVSDREFCVINTPPIVWQQTYLNWLEHEEGEIDYADAKHSFLELVHRVAEFLGIPLRPASDRLEVYTCGDLSFLKALAEDKGFSKKDIQRIKRQILASESYCIPQRHIVYLGNLSINHAAEEAAHYLKYLCSGRERPRPPVDAFYANIIHEALGFFGSKIINHKRKCFHEKDYSGLIRYLSAPARLKGRKMERDVSLLIVKHRLMDRKGMPIKSARFFLGRHDLFFGVTHGLGYMLGDRLYYALVHDRIGKDEIRGVFRDAMRKEGAPYELYRKLLKKVRGVKIPKRA